MPVESGVPRCSVLGPCLFLFYINDIPDGLHSTCRLFADDTIVYLSVKSNSDAHQIQNDLNQIADWKQKWSMEFHPDKCNVLSITRAGRSKSPIIYNYKLHGHTLQHVPCVNRVRSLVKILTGPQDLQVAMKQKSYQSARNSISPHNNRMINC